MLVVRIWCIIILGVRIRSHWNTAAMIASISLHVSLQRSSMIYMYYVLSMKRQNCKRLTVLNAIKKGRSHRLLNALALIALVQCERTLTKNHNNLGSSAISTRFYSLYCVYYLTRYFNRVFMLVYFVPNALVFILACLMVNLEVFVAPLMKNVFRRFYNCVCY